MQIHIRSGVGCSLALSLFLGSGAKAEDPVFFSWLRQHDSGSSPAMLYPASGTTHHYTYCPQPGGNHGQGNYDAYNSPIESIWDEMDAEGLPVALMMRDRNSPWGSAPTWDCTASCGGDIPDYPKNNNTTIPRSPETLASAFAIRDVASGQVNYILCDLEPFNGNDMIDIESWLINITNIAFGSSSLGVTGYPDGLLNPTHNVSQNTVQSWGVLVGNYNMHRYPIIDLTNEGGLNTYTDITMPWKGNSQTDDIASYNSIYDSLNLSIINPVTYARTSHIIHTNHWTNIDSPNARAAYLWASIEKMSFPVREEIVSGDLTGKKVLPWVSPFVPVSGHSPTSETYAGCWMPPSEDFLATIQHLRLRGADGFIFWTSAGKYDPGSLLETTFWSQTDPMTGKHLNPWYDASAEWADAMHSPNGTEWFETNALVAWEVLDGEYDADAVVYRLDTDKTSGAIVSAVNDRGRLHILISYMNSSGTSFDLNPYFPEARDYHSTATQYISVGAYSHTYTSDFFTPDIDGDGDADVADSAIWNTLYSAHDPRADWNQDSAWNSSDQVLYGSAYYNFNN